jgi:hypothetical protein
MVTSYAISSELLLYVWSGQNSRYKYKSTLPHLPRHNTDWDLETHQATRSCCQK